jgi:hypothetical protein
MDKKVHTIEVYSHGDHADDPFFNEVHHQVLCDLSEENLSLDDAGVQLSFHRLSKPDGQDPYANDRVIIKYTHTAEIAVVRIIQKITATIAGLGRKMEMQAQRV